MVATGRDLPNISTGHIFSIFSRKFLGIQTSRAELAVLFVIFHTFWVQYNWYNTIDYSGIYMTRPVGCFHRFVASSGETAFARFTRILFVFWPDMTRVTRICAWDLQLWLEWYFVTSWKEVRWLNTFGKKRSIWHMLFYVRVCFETCLFPQR